MVLLHTHKSKFMYAYKKSTAFPETVFAKFINAHQHHTLILYTKFTQTERKMFKVLIQINLSP